MSSQWHHAGFPMDEMLELPVFDRRNPEREGELLKTAFVGIKPKILYCLNGSGSSPFPHGREVMPLLWKHRNTHDLIDLTSIRAAFLFDLLGLIDRSALVITSDTSILHLCGASKTPYIAFIQNQGGGSIPRGNCAGVFRYGAIPQRLSEIDASVSSVINREKRNL